MTDAISLRVLLLAAWAAAVNLWLERHVGIGLTDPLSLLGLTSAATVLSYVLDWSLQAEQQERLQALFRGRIRRLIRYLLATPVLVVLYLIGGMVAVTVSAITVIPPTDGQKMAVGVFAAGEGAARASVDMEAGSGPRRLLMATNPFGSDFRISASGFVARTVTLYPLVGLTIDPARDLDPLPTVLFRPTIDARVSLKGGGRLLVFKVTHDGCLFLGRAGADGKAPAFMVGVRRVVPPNLPAIWNLQLTAAQTDDSTRAETILAWTAPASVAIDSPPSPGDELYAVVRTRADKDKATARLTVGQEPFQDILMSDDLDVVAACKEPT